ncbi:hypothetical protein [Candidatus Hydrogenosomobacter endosymbioticus]|nr:hypothetical protein [Candidatus Hydrogenosomobacter endosymbioticus]
MALGIVAISAGSAQGILKKISKRWFSCPDGYVICADGKTVLVNQEMTGGQCQPCTEGCGHILGDGLQSCFRDHGGLMPGDPINSMHFSGNGLAKLGVDELNYIVQVAAATAAASAGDPAAAGTLVASSASKAASNSGIKGKKRSDSQKALAQANGNSASRGNKKTSKAVDSSGQKEDKGEQGSDRSQNLQSLQNNRSGSQSKQSKQGTGQQDAVSEEDMAQITNQIAAEVTKQLQKTLPEQVQKNLDGAATGKQDVVEENEGGDSD